MKVLFIGIGNSAPSWYRCGLPGLYLHEESDWIGYIGYPPDKGAIVSGSLYNPKFSELDEYDIIVVQQVKGEPWLKQIKDWQAKGIKVVYECDDFLHGIKKIKNHSYKTHYNKRKIKEFEACMRQCDAMIVSTERLAKYYEKYNENIYVCLVGIDTKRYDVEMPDKEWVTIGWAGGTGHDLAIKPWLQAVANLMSSDQKLSFCSIGTNYASLMNELFPHRCLSVPWIAIENLPYALTNIDIVIAPAHESKYHLAKSNLRWLEASAVGIPVVADSRIYFDIENGVTGVSMDCSAPEMMQNVEDELAVLVFDETERRKLGENAKQFVTQNKDISILIEQWESAFSSICQA